jgi:hypothetical protein
MKRTKLMAISLVAAGGSLAMAVFAQTQNFARTGVQDPGVRSGSVSAGSPLATLNAAQLQYFQDGLARFTQVDSVSGMVSGEPGSGLGPSFNSNSCGSCHSQPAQGGSSPTASEFPNIGPNPQISAASDAGESHPLLHHSRRARAGGAISVHDDFQRFGDPSFGRRSA